MLCTISANAILKDIDRNVDPCDNFYKFACGGFLNSTEINNNRGRSDLVATYEDKILEQLRVSYEAITATDQTRHLRLVKNLYDSCMDTCKSYYFISQFLSSSFMNHHYLLK